MLYAALATVLLGAFCLIGFAIQRLFKLAEHALLFGRARDAADLATAIEQVETTKLAKPVPKRENTQEESETLTVTMPDGTVRELEPVLGGFR